MKKTFTIVILFCLLSTLTFAQTEKGKFLISGKSSLDFVFTSSSMFGGNLSTEDYIFSDGYKLEFSPSVGYFVINNLAVGIGSSYSLSDGDFQNKTSQLTIMPTALYYFFPKSMVRPFIQAGFGYASVSQKISVNNGGYSNESFNGVAWGTGIGAAFTVIPSISIDLTLEFAEVYTKFSEDSDIKFETKGIGAMIGFTFYF